MRATEVLHKLVVEKNKSSSIKSYVHGLISRVECRGHDEARHNVRGLR